jgi:uncharacterized protein YbaR (Trm112 family)
MITDWARQALRCPTCGGELEDVLPQDAAGECASQPIALRCPAEGVAYPVREGIPVLLAGEAVAA